MKRLYSYLEDTFPFINDDFNDVLQNQHMIAYSAYLDGINDMKYSTQSTNRGIVLSGIEINADPVSPPTSFTGKMKWQITIDKSTALIYFDGQYYSPADSILNEGDQQTVVLPYTSTGLIFYPLTQSSIRSFKNGLSQSMTIDYRFDIASGTGFFSNFEESIVSAQQGPFPGSTQGSPYVFCSWGGTSRNLSRLLKYNNAVKDDIFISYEPKRWFFSGQTPIGNYKLLDEYLYRDFAWYFIQKSSTNVEVTTPFTLGRNEMKGFAGLGDIGGRFMVGYDRLGSTGPPNAGLYAFNYGLPGNVGGTQGVTFSASQLPAHNHGGFTEKTNQNLDHAHVFYGGESDENGGSFGDLDAKGVGYGNPPNGGNNEVFLTRSLPYWIQQTDTHIIPENSVDFTNHKHVIDSVGQNKPHENRPPYIVTLFYYKL